MRPPAWWKRRAVCFVTCHRLIIIILPRNDIAQCTRCGAEWGEWPEN